MRQDTHDNIYEERDTTKEKLHEFEQSSQNASFAWKKTSRQSEFLDKKKSRAHGMTESKKDEGIRNDKMKKSAKSKLVLTEQSEKERFKVGTISFCWKTLKKKVQDRKSTSVDFAQRSCTGRAKLLQEGQQDGGRRKISVKYFSFLSFFCHIWNKP